MGCNCKSSNKDGYSNDNETSEVQLKNDIVKYSLKVFGFLIMLVLLPIINVLIIWFIFNTLVLNKDVDLKPLLLMIGNKFSEKYDNADDEYDEDELTEENFITTNVEDITK